MSEEQFDIHAAAHTAGKLQSLLDQLGRARLVLGAAAQAAHGQHLWSEERKAAILAEHTAAAHAVAEKLVAEGKVRADAIVGEAEQRAKAHELSATGESAKKLDRLTAAVVHKERALADLDAEIAGAQANLAAIEQRIKDAKGVLRA